ncbi:MAG: acyl-CoA reductase, partial [Bacteroidota bacterium]
MGCRNVAKLYVPGKYNFNPLLEALHEYRQIVTHNKYKNNFDYNYAIHDLNKTPFKANGCVMLLENTGFSSRVGEL